MWQSSKLTSIAKIKAKLVEGQVGRIYIMTSSQVYPKIIGMLIYKREVNISAFQDIREGHKCWIRQVWISFLKIIVFT